MTSIQNHFTKQRKDIRNSKKYVGREIESNISL